MPYLSLKVLWIFGVGVGVLGADFVAQTRGDNIVTAILDLCAAGLAVLFVHPAGRRVPAWLIAGPVWAATGLLAPLVGGVILGFPTQILLGARSPGTDDGGLDSWVFAVVYSGFILQAAVLLPGFVLYAADRWPAVFDAARGRGERRTPTTSEQLLAGAFVVGALAFAMLTGYGAIAGGGLYPHPTLSQRISQLVFAALAIAGMSAVWRLRDGRRPTRRLLIAGWVGSGVVFTESLVLTTGLLLARDSYDRTYGPGGSLLCLFCLLAALAGAAFGMLRLEQFSRTARASADPLRQGSGPTPAGEEW
ncbi:hypothetical protein ACQHIV_03815 [Kribbella sp. GL6]|uniref:hypothetical protein n=1 Tax=Kribbella sp. GL6 TaxID=3419765 RepID=UPI003D074CD9